MSLFSGGFWGRSADTGRESSRTSSTRTGTSSVVELLPGKTNGPSSSNLSCALSALPETRRLVVTEALDHLFNKSHFSICQLDTIMAIVHAPKGDAYRLLQALHCKDYAEMRPEMRERIPALVAETLKGGDSSRIATDQVLAALE